MKTRILLTGSNGLVGQTLLRKLAGFQDLDLMVTSLHENRYPYKEGYRFWACDLSDPQAVNSLITGFNPDCIIHTAAMTQVDPCETDPEACRKANVLATANLATAASNVGARFIYLSTDFVFDGRQGPYSEEDTPSPVSHYGTTKLEGERIVRESGVHWAIVRTILVYGLAPYMGRTNLVLWVRDALSRREPIRVVNDQFRMPTLVDDLATAVTEIMTRRAQGIYHVCGPEMLSVYEMAVRVARHFKLDEALISPVSSRTLNQTGMRPPSTGFVLEKARRDLNYRPHTLEEGLRHLEVLLNNQTA